MLKYLCFSGDMLKIFRSRIRSYHFLLNILCEDVAVHLWIIPEFDIFPEAIWFMSRRYYGAFYFLEGYKSLTKWRLSGISLKMFGPCLWGIEAALGTACANAINVPFNIFIYDANIILKPSFA